MTQAPEFKESKGDTGVPTIVWRGEIGADTITVTECLGPNLKKLFLLMDKQFSIPTIATIAIQVVNYFLKTELNWQVEYAGIHSSS